MSKLNVLRLADDTIIHLWLIDRIACGLGFEITASDFYVTFEKELSKMDYDSFKEKYRDQIKERYDQMREQVYKSGVFAKMTNLVDIMFTKLDDDQYTPREFSAVASTLRGYLDDLTKFGKEKQEGKIQTQNNFLILKSLEKENLIEIRDAEKLRYLLDGEIVDAEVTTE